MLLLINVLLTLWCYTAHGQGKPCDYPVIKHGWLYYSYRGYFPAYVNQQFIYSCDRYFVPPSQRSWDHLTCTAQGWSPEEPCLRQCIFNYLENGYNPHREEKYLQGKTVKVHCYEGYSLQNDQNTMTCTESGWSPPPTCIRVKTCSKSEIRIENGFLSESTFTYPLNKQTEYKCKPGYVTADGKTSGLITCLQDGWSAQPVCIKSCDRPVFEKAKVKSDGTWFKLNDSLDYECLDGYETRDGRTTGSIVCGQDGWSDKAACYWKPCDYPVIKHGWLYYSYRGYFPAYVNQQFIYSCDRYFVPPSQRSWDHLTCTAQGWSPEEPCLRQCIFNYLENGYNPHREEKYLQGETVKVRCYEGYSLQNDQNTMTCTESGWSPPPRCIRVKTCSKSEIRIENGFLSESTFTYPLNKQTEYKCKPGYVTADGKTSGLITCLQDGWSAQPVCIRKPCDYPVIKHGWLYYSYRGYFPAYVNQQFIYSCDRYFVPPSQRSWDHLTCTAQGWSPEEPCLRQCIFNYLENGYNPHREEKYLQGETVKVRCYEGYSLQNDQNTMTCTESGWSPPPRCIRVKTCSKSEIRIENGFLSESTFTYPLNKQTEYKCKPGYVTADGKTSGLITCLQDGWSAQPVCIKSCDRPVFEKAKVKSDGTWFKLNDSLDYECLDGYETRDGRTTGSIVCGQDGWSDKAACYGQCIFNYLENGHNPHHEEKYLQGETVTVRCYEGYSLQNDQNTMNCTESGWSPPPRCIRVKTCSKSEIRIENGFLSESAFMYPLNKQTEYKCKPGYVTADGKTSGLITCLQNGWSAQPVCINSKGKCGPPPPIDNGDITSLLQSVYPPGYTAEYQCQLYYELRGNRNIVCQNGEWSEPPKCLEACVISEETMKKHHIQLRWKHDTKLYYKTEDTIEFTCEYGYHQLTPKHTFRTTCQEGKVVYPRCG
ncbi:complement factor H-related protein 4-like isoform X3 [Ovis canadensis]|uniref:complement factor H-related protein 4-like isoform X3 n=1 Tax=Ovis canadensis TaxID=37174 RepID=UPI00375089D2